MLMRDMPPSRGTVRSCAVGDHEHAYLDIFTGYAINAVIRLMTIDQYFPSMLLSDLTVLSASAQHAFDLPICADVIHQPPADICFSFQRNTMF
jgi:hypothetical protein